MRNVRTRLAGIKRAARLSAVLLVLGLLAQVGFAADPVPAARGRYARQLQRECDELLALAVRRPYGWAWAEGKPDPKPKGGGQVVAQGPGETPAAAFILFWAGDLLDLPDYKRAAYEAARGMAAAQRPAGFIPPRATFLPGVAGGRDDVALVADRGPTRAMLGLTLSMLEESGGNEPMLHGCAQRGLAWMLRQQAPVGGWPLGYPPATAPKDAVRITRLDVPDYRDSTLALLLAADVLNDNVARAAADRAMTALTRMRIGNVSRIGSPLWATCYGLDTFVTDRVPGYPAGVDVLASRNAMQTLMAAWVVLGNPPVVGEEDPRVPFDRAVREATAAVVKLPVYGDGQWLRIYNYDVETTPPPPKDPVPLFNRPLPPQEAAPAVQVGTWGMRSVLRTSGAMQGKSREQFAATLAAHLPVHQRLAAAICGLDDQPLSVDWPTNAADAERFLREYAGTFTVLEGPVPEPLHERVARLWTLWLRARIEIKFGK